MLKSRCYYTIFKPKYYLKMLILLKSKNFITESEHMQFALKIKSILLSLISFIRINEIISYQFNHFIKVHLRFTDFKYAKLFLSQYYSNKIAFQDESAPLFIACKHAGK